MQKVAFIIKRLVGMIKKHNYNVSNGYECTCCRNSNILDKHGFSHSLSGCNVFVLRLGTLFGNFA